MSMSRLLASTLNRILDPSIVFSFDRTGFIRHQAGFEPSDLDVDLSGRVFAVTGANSGIGLATAHALAGLGAEVWMLCRNAERGEAARSSVMAQTGSQAVHLALVDVSDLESVARFADAFPHSHLDGLIHNAGVLLSERSSSPQGMELTLATNLVGPMALTHQLIGHLAAGERSRVIWVSSGGMYSQRLDLQSLVEPPGRFDGVKAYARTKRAMVMVAEVMAEQLSGLGVSVHCMHPGWADTPGVQTSIPGFWRVTRAILRSPEEGADTVIWLAGSDRAHSTPGLFWFDRKPRSTHLLPGTQSTQAARDEVWLRIHELAGISPLEWTKHNLQEST